MLLENTLENTVFSPSSTFENMSNRVKSCQLDIPTSFCIYIEETHRKLAIVNIQNYQKTYEVVKWYNPFISYSHTVYYADPIEEL